MIDAPERDLENRNVCAVIGFGKTGPPEAGANSYEVDPFRGGEK